MRNFERFLTSDISSSSRTIGEYYHDPSYVARKVNDAEQSEKRKIVLYLDITLWEQAGNCYWTESKSNQKITCMEMKGIVWVTTDGILQR